MKIKEVSTRQFAGIKNRKLSLEDGLNVIIGKNEAGKSTMIELIRQTFYRKSELSKKEKGDKDFFARFIPSDKKGDVVDGKVVFTGQDGDYELQKKWGASSLCELIDPNGSVIADEERIRKIIDDVLIYKKGLYDDVVFASQKNQADVVEHILGKLDSKAVEKQDMVSIIASEGVCSAGGISPEDIEKIIRANISELDGHWDFDHDYPEKRRGIENPWKRDTGKIVEAYYAYAELEEQLRQTEEIESAIDNHNAQIKETISKKNEYSLEKDEYERYAEAIAAYRASKSLKDSKTLEKNRIEADRESYSRLLDEHTRGAKLQKTVEARDIIAKYEKINAAKEKLEDAKKNLSSKSEITNGDELKYSNADRKIESLKGKLSGMNLVAKVNRLGDADIQIRSAVSGEVIDFSAGDFKITEAIEITIPGVMSMSLAPQGVDVDDIKAQISLNEDVCAEVLTRTGAKDLDDLRNLKEDYSNSIRQLEKAEAEYKMALGDNEFSEVENAYNKVKDLDYDYSSVDEEIASLCGKMPVDEFVTQRKALYERIENEYNEEDPIGAMDDRLQILNQELEKLKNIDAAVASVPEKFLTIEDGDRYKENLNNNIKNAEAKITELMNQLRAEEKKLGDADPDDLRGKIDDAKAEFLKKKEECSRWNRILDALIKTKEAMGGESMMSDVKEKFEDYLSMITRGGVSVDSMDENMDIQISSSGNPMTYEILSEGTKDTIALAFRLAMLEHLFPEGGGVVVFDDPFTEMDEDRTRQACKLVQKFAEKGNQVIFTTCDNKYKDLMSGKFIEI